MKTELKGGCWGGGGFAKPNQSLQDFAIATINANSKGEKGRCHTLANSLPCFVQKTPQTCMCATNVSHLPTKITAKGGEKQYPGGYCTKVEFNKSRITEKARLDQV